jgi:alanine racemase
MSRPRLRHVADLAGVSEATVSRVVNDRPGVAESTRRAVLAALHQLDYEPTGVRRRTRTGLVGLIVPELTNPVFPAFAAAIESQLAARGFTALLCTSTPSGMQELDYLDVLEEHKVAGVVVVSGMHADRTADHSRYTELSRSGTPVVVINGRTPDLEVPSVSVDHRHASDQVIAHLVGLGHRRIGLATGPERYVPAVERIEGFGLAATRYELEAAPTVTTVFGNEGGHAAARLLLEQDITAIVCGSDLMALGAIRAVEDLGLGVPSDISIVGFDDAGPWQYTSPPLTTVRQPIDDMSAAAVRLLVDAGGHHIPPTTALSFRTELVVRGSTGPATVRSHAAD